MPWTAFSNTVVIIHIHYKSAQSNKDDERNKLVKVRDEIILICKKIESHKNSIDVKEKLTPIFFVVRNLIDDLYYRHPVNRNTDYWNIVRKLAE